MAQLTTMQAKVSGTLAEQHAIYKRYFDKEVTSLPAFQASQMVYLT